MEANAWVATTAAALAAAKEEVVAPSRKEDAVNRPPTPASWGEDSEASADAVFPQAMHDKGLCVTEMEPDSSCLFRSVAGQIFGDPDHHYQAGVVEKENMPAE